MEYGGSDGVDFTRGTFLNLEKKLREIASKQKVGEALDNDF